MSDLAATVIDLLRKRSESISCAESITGGAITSKLVSRGPGRDLEVIGQSPQPALLGQQLYMAALLVRSGLQFWALIGKKV